MPLAGATQTSGGSGRQRQCNCKSYLKTDFDVRKTKATGTRERGISGRGAGGHKVCAPRTEDGNAGRPGRACPGDHRAARQWSQIQVQHELGTTGHVGTETGVLRWQRSTLGGRSGCAGPSSLTREGEPLLPHKGVVWPLAALWRRQEWPGPVAEHATAGRTTDLGHQLTGLRVDGVGRVKDNT